MSNKNLAKTLLVGIGLTFVAVLIEPSDLATADFLYTVSGILMLIAGTWLSVRVINNNDK